MAYDFRLFVTGDPIKDIYSYGEFNDHNRWHDIDTISCEGGAANTYRNAIHINGLSRNLVCITDEFPHDCNALIRLIDFSTGQLEAELWDHFSEPSTMYRLHSRAFKRYCVETLGVTKYGMIISEYNKGVCNRPTKRDIPELEFVIVDSRYRTLHPTWLNFAKLKIWHATGEEYQPDWAKQFDYTIHTNGPHPVRIYNKQQQQVISDIHVPYTPVLDAVGAGDTFTAALGVYLANTRARDFQIYATDIIEATKFGVWCAQDVITKPRTATCTRTLQEYKTR